MNISFQFNLGSSASFPVLMISGKAAVGKADEKIFSVDTNPDPGNNEKLYPNANALYAALRTGSVGLLEKANPPSRLKVHFHDNSSSFRFFHLVSRTLSTNGNIDIDNPDGTQDHFVNLTSGGQSGKSYQAVVEDAANYLVERITKNGDYSISTNAAPDPGQTLFGLSNTRDSNFQARVNPGVIGVDSITDPFVQVVHRQGGWDIDAKKMINLADTQGLKFGFSQPDDPLFPINFMKDTHNVKLYRFNVAVNFYKKAIQKILSMTPQVSNRFISKYSSEYHCDPNNTQKYRGSANLNPAACAAIVEFEGAFSRYRSGKSNKWEPEKLSKIIFDIVEDLEEFADFKDIVSFLGGTDDIYVTGTITGFREGSELLSDPINGNAKGKRDKYNPSGVVSSAQQRLQGGIDDGEFKNQWMRDRL